MMESQDRYQDKSLINNQDPTSGGNSGLTALVQQATVPRARCCRKMEVHFVRSAAHPRRRMNYED